MCTSQLTSVLFIYFKLEVYFFWKKSSLQFLIALSFLSKLSRNSFFMHRRRRATYDQISAVSVDENKCISPPNQFDEIYDPKIARK